MSDSRPRLDDLRIERPSAPAGGNRLLTWGLAALVVAALLFAAWRLSRPAPPSVSTAAVRELSTAPGDRTVLNASGYVTARREATVSSKVTGKVIEVLVEEGVRVAAGQVLAHLDDTNARGNLDLARAQLDSARSSLEETRVRLAEAELDLRRQASLLERTVATQADFDRADASVRALKARLIQQDSAVTVAARTVAIWEQQVDDTIIRAPFAGIVTSKNAQPGEMISPMSAGGFTRTGICTIVDMESLEIEIDVNESYINRVAPGQAVEAALDAYPDWKIPCKVIAIIPTADRQKSTVRVRVGFDRLDPRILPQMAVKVGFREAAGGGNAAPARLFIVPRTALQSAAGRDVVFVVQRERAERRAVAVAGAQDADVLLASGVAPGEAVILNPPPGLADGAAVRIQNP